MFIAEAAWWTSSESLSVSCIFSYFAWRRIRAACGVFVQRAACSVLRRAERGTQNAERFITAERGTQNAERFRIWHRASSIQNRESKLYFRHLKEACLEEYQICSGKAGEQVLANE
jgi:hypothetical protein